MKILLSFAGLAPRILLGFWIVHFLWKSTDKNTFWVKVFLSAAVGFGFSSLMGFLWIWANLPLAAYAVLESVFAIVLTIWMVYKHWNEWKLVFSVTLKIKVNPAWGVVLLAGVFLFAFNLWMHALQYPHGRPDAWINWNVTARFIHLGGAEWQNTFLRQLDHPDYPLFLAMTNAITWTLTHSSSVWGPITFHFVLSFFTAGLLFAVIHLLRGFRQAVLVTLFFIALPFTVDNGMRQYADLLLSYLILAAGGLSLLYFDQRDYRAALLAGFLVGLAGWTKNEGLMAIIGFTAVWVVAGFRRERPALKNYLLGLTLPLLVILLFKIFLAPPNDLVASKGDMLVKITDITRYTLILREAGFTFWKIGSAPINMIGLIIIYAIWVGRNRTNIAGMWMIGAVILIQLSAYFVIYLLTPRDLAWHLNTSLDRLYSHVFPLALMWAFIWLKSPRELSENTKEEAYHAPHH